MKKKRKRLMLRYLIDQRHIIFILLGLIGLVYIPINLYRFISERGDVPLIIFIIQMIWIIGASILVLFFLTASRFRKQKKES
jgi:hypothetical protein